MRSASCAALLLTAAVTLARPAHAQTTGQYRGFWVDTFNTALNTHADVLQVVNNATAARANALFVQVRRRGDSWYLDSLEPPADRTPLAAGFDPLADMIAEAHARGIEVHAFVIVNALWNRAPVTAPGVPVPLFPPTDPAHVFNRHGVDQSTGWAYTGRDNWLTRSLLPDGTAGAALTYEGHRIGSDFWMEPGHPEAAAYTVEVFTHLVRQYDIDGLHLDRIRYPELGVSGQTPATGANIGYNATSVERFQRRYGLPSTAIPAQNDPAWSQWRRHQVTNLVRRIYLESIALKPQLKVSAALIAFGGFNATLGWPSAEAYWRVYQDWDAWTREGILDLAIPMNYKREHVVAQATQYDQWIEWAKNHAYGRSVMIGQGAFLNSVEGTLRQTRRALAPSTTGNLAAGVVFFSMATSNVAVAANSLSIPAGQNTPARPFAEFAAGLTTGKSVNGLTLYEMDAVPVFAAEALVPDMPWKSLPQVGHLKGVVKDGSGAAVDSGGVVLARVHDGTTPATGRTEVTGATDGNGFYGGVDLAPGLYEVTVTPTGGHAWTASCRKEVTAGQVATLDLVIDGDAPTLTLTVDPSELWPPSRQTVAVTVRGVAADAGTGVDSVQLRVIDEYGRVEPAIARMAGNGAATLDWTVAVDLEAARDGEDRDGRVYTIEAVVTDKACQTATASAQVLVPHDRGRRAGNEGGAGID